MIKPHTLACSCDNSIQQLREKFKKTDPLVMHPLPSTLKKLVGHIAFGLCVPPSQTLKKLVGNIAFGLCVPPPPTLKKLVGHLIFVIQIGDEV